MTVPLEVGRNEVWTTIDVTAAWDGAGDLIANTTDSYRAIVRNINVFPFDCQLNGGEWVSLGHLKCVTLDGSLATNSFRVRKGRYSGTCTARLEVLSALNQPLVDGDTEVSLAGVGGATAFTDLSDAPATLVGGSYLGTNADGSAIECLSAAGPEGFASGPSGPQVIRQFGANVYATTDYDNPAGGANLSANSDPANDLGQGTVTLNASNSTRTVQLEMTAHAGVDAAYINMAFSGDGYWKITGLPTANPAVAGAIYEEAGLLQLSGSTVTANALLVGNAGGDGVTQSSVLVVEPDLVINKTSGAGIKVDVDSPTFGWRDIIGNVQPKATGAGSPTRAAYAGGTLGDYAFIQNDIVDFVFHIPHDYVPGTDVYFHVHWSHTGTTTTGDAKFTIYHTYSKGHNQANFPAEKTLDITYATVDVATTPRYRHRVDEIIISGTAATATLMDRDDIEVDGLILVTLKLATLPTLGGSGKLFIHTCDIHYQSTNMATKSRAPNFYTEGSP